MTQPIQIEVRLKSSIGIDKAWNEFNDPEAIKKWNAASPDWHTPRAENKLEVGSGFSYRMEAKDGSEGFDFEGAYTEIVPQKLIKYIMPDGRKVEVVFRVTGEEMLIQTIFDPENENSIELQRAGWQAILDNFKKYLENG